MVNPDLVHNLLFTIFYIKKLYLFARSSFLELTCLYAIDFRMAQLGLDKTAEEFRVLHHERQVAIGKWQEATDLIAKRDEELQAIFNNVRVYINDVTKVFKSVLIRIRNNDFWVYLLLNS